MAVLRLRPSGRWAFFQRHRRGGEGQTRRRRAILASRSVVPKGRSQRDRSRITDLRGIKDRGRCRKNSLARRGSEAPAAWPETELPGMTRQVTDHATVGRWVVGYDLAWRAPRTAGVGRIFIADAGTNTRPTMSCSSASTRSARCGAQSGRLTDLSWSPRSFAVEGPTASLESRSAPGTRSARNTADLWIVSPRRWRALQLVRTAARVTTSGSGGSSLALRSSTSIQVDEDAAGPGCRVPVGCSAAG